LIVGPPPARAVIPEPATLALLGLGGLTVLRRRRVCARPRGWVPWAAERSEATTLPRVVLLSDFIFFG